MKTTASASHRRPRFARTCRDVTRLVLEGEDRELRWLERWALRSHMLICKACPRFARQVALMRGAVGRWSAYQERGEGE
jgi:hypothetical protein